MAKKKGAAILPLEPETPTVNRLFVTISGMGVCDPNNKTLLSYGFKKNIAPPDRPLKLAEDMIRLVTEMSQYSSPQKAIQDVDELAEVVLLLQARVRKKFAQEKADGDERQDAASPHAGETVRQDSQGD